LGFDLAGDVVEIGDRATGFQLGDAIYGIASLSGGGYAEFAAVPAKSVAPKPRNLNYVEAASIPGAAITALQALRDCGKLESGQSVLINGASGGVGSFAVQIGKLLKAEVTGVCSTRNLEWVKGLGCDRVIDYTQQDFTREAARYDLIFDAVAKRSFGACKTALKPRGIYVNTLPNASLMLQSLLTALLPGKKAKLVFESPNRKDLAYLKDAIEAGKIRTVIDRVYPLSEIAEAHRYSETERAAGKIGIEIEHSS
ncbi:MAG: NAD(P)-dependent alcohol dehydrogenase, partial [Cyanobacteriota bacterium]|nr:NAD(P)-dependent alcohol dehydrogenase [Cyanobacteriota bacterium]